MKRTIIILASAAMTAGYLLSACSSPSQKVENAQEDVKEANKKLDKANDAYLADIESYRKETDEKIAANDKSISEFNARTENEKKALTADYIKNMKALEQKNSDLKKKMSEYKAEGKEQWEIFKTEFNHQLDELNKSFKAATSKNDK